jgi:hypothetical protein
VKRIRERKAGKQLRGDKGLCTSLQEVRSIDCAYSALRFSGIA